MKINRIEKRNTNSNKSAFIMLGCIITVFVIAGLVALCSGGFSAINLNMIIRDVKEEVYDSIPIETSTNINFLTKSSKHKDVVFSYESTNEEVLKSDGNVVRRLSDVYVQINITITIPDHEDIVMYKSIKILKHSSLDAMEIIESELRKVIRSIIASDEVIDGTELPLQIIVDGNVIDLEYEKYAKKYGTSGEEGTDNDDVTSIEIEKLTDKAIVHVKSSETQERCRIVVYVNYGGQIKPVSIAIFTQV